MQPAWWILADGGPFKLQRTVATYQCRGVHYWHTVQFHRIHLITKSVSNKCLKHDPQCKPLLKVLPEHVFTHTATFVKRPSFCASLSTVPDATACVKIQVFGPHSLNMLGARERGTAGKYDTLAGFLFSIGFTHRGANMFHVYGSFMILVKFDFFCYVFLTLWLKSPRWQR